MRRLLVIVPFLFALPLAARAQDVGSQDISAIEEIALHLGAAIGQDVPTPTQSVMEGFSGPTTWCSGNVKDLKRGDEVLVRGCSNYQGGGKLHPQWVYYQGRLTIFRLVFTGGATGTWGTSLREKLVERWSDPTMSGATSIWSWADGAVVMTQVEDALVMWRQADYEATKAAVDDADEIEQEEEEEPSSPSDFSFSFGEGDYDGEWVALSFGAVYNQATVFQSFEEVSSTLNQFGGFTFGLNAMFDESDGLRIGILMESGYMYGSGLGCIGIEPGTACTGAPSEGFGSSSAVTIAPVEYAWVPFRFGPIYYSDGVFQVFWGYTFGANYIRVTRTGPIAQDTAFSATTPGESREQTGWKGSVDTFLGAQFRLTPGLAIRGLVRATYARATHFEEDGFKIPNIDASGVTLETSLLWGL